MTSAPPPPRPLPTPQPETDFYWEKANKDKQELISPRGGVSPRRRWFGSTLPDIMSSQEPGEKVPRVVTVLLNAVLAMNGARRGKPAKCRHGAIPRDRGGRPHRIPA